MKVRLPRRLLLRIVGSIAGVYLVAMGATWALHDMLAEREAKIVLGRVLDDVQGQIEEEVNRQQILKAMIARDRLREMSDWSRSSLAALADELQVDQICVADTNGTIIAAAQEENLRLNLGTLGGQAAEFLCLLNDETEFAQRLQPNASCGKYCKYVGVWRPEGGLIQVGCYESTLRRVALPVVVGITHHRHVGGEGTVVVTTETGEIVSDAIEMGLEGASYQQPGEDVFVSSRTIEGFVVHALLPKSAAALRRNALVGVSATLTVFVILFGVIFVGISVASYVREQIEKRVAADLEMAKNIQLSALPAVFPPYPDEFRMDVCARMDAAREVGGDFYDFYHVGPDQFAILIADVSGKGVPAAMFMMKAKTLIKSCMQSFVHVEEALGEVNLRLAEGNGANIFVTCWIGVIDLRTGILTYVNAGHNPPLVRQSNGALTNLTLVSGPPLGVFQAAKYRHQTHQLEPGDVLVLYTDGVTEAIDLHESAFGLARLEAVVRASARPEELCRRIKGAVDAFAGAAEQFDDITVLAFKYRGEPQSETREFPATLESLTSASAFVESSLARTACPDDIKAKIMIALDEIGSNIARYSNSPTMRVTCECADEPPVIRLTFADSGVAWNPLVHRDPDVSLPLKERAIGGLGILMVKKLMDSVRYERRENENVLQLRKQLPW